jgi:beta-glucosidase
MGTPKPFNEFYLADPLMDSIRVGKMSEVELDIHLKRILRLMHTVKSMGRDDRKKGSINTEAHFKDSYDIAKESVVLLKNSNNLLPINTSGLTSIAVIGNNAKKKNALGGFGAGVKTKREVTPLEGLQNRLLESVKINYAEGYQERYAPKKIGVLGEVAEVGEVTQEQLETIDELDPKMLEEAIKAAKNSDVAVIFAGSNRDFETEASDRADLELPFGQVELIEEVLKVNPNTIVVMIGGAPFDLGTIKQKSSALVWSWFNGSEGGNALADVLLGNVNPSGKLPWTMPKKLEDSPAHATNSFPGDKSVSYDEGLLVGYRWFDTKNIEPLYPFGFGLSYSSFDIKNVQVDKEDYTKSETIYVTLTIENTGEVDGKEVVQLYVSKANSEVERAVQELKGFKKVLVETGQTKTITLELPVSELAYYNVSQKAWTVESGTYSLKIGNSSRDLKNELNINIK